MNTIACPDGVRVSVDQARYNGFPRSVDDLLKLVLSINGGHLVVVINGGDPAVSNYTKSLCTALLALRDVNPSLSLSPSNRSDRSPTPTFISKYMHRNGRIPN